MTSLNIAQVSADRGIAPGSTKGAAQHLRGIAAGLGALGHRVELYSARKSEGFPVPVRGLSELNRLEPGDVDIVYERYSLGHLGGLRQARRLGARFVLEVNAPLVDEAQQHRPETVEPTHRDSERTLVRDADLVISVSSVLTAWVREHRTGPVRTIPNGFEPSWFRTGLSTSASPTLAFIGHPKPWHGADRLPRLLANLSATGVRPELLVIGGGRGAEHVSSCAESLGVADQVTITGALPPAQASAMLAQATIGIAPYRRQDPFYFCPLKVIDYLAAGLPIVATRQGDIPTLVDDAGILVHPDDDRGLALAVASLLEDPGRAAQLGSNGRHRAWATMTWTQAAADTAIAISALEPAGASADALS